MNELERNYMRRQLQHHGILGQKWGKRNGPPYPLGASQHSASERKAGWRKSLDKSKDESHTKSNHNRYVEAGKSAVSAMSGRLAGSINDESIQIGKRVVASVLGNSDGSSNGIRRLNKPETLEETLRNANPLKGTREGQNNCVPSAIAGFMRQQGYDVTAKGTDGKMQNTAGVVEECFKGVKVLDGSATKFGLSRQDAVEMLLKRYGQNAEGICAIDWNNRPGGHCFSWKIKDSVVSFFDNNIGKGDEYVSKVHFNSINPNGQLVLARLDGLEIDMEAVVKYVTSN